MTSHFKSTDLGTKFLHQHSVFVIEDLGKKYFRCRNTTENIIDKLYINSLIDDKEYHAGQFVLYVCLLKLQTTRDHARFVVFFLFIYLLFILLFFVWKR